MRAVATMRRYHAEPRWGNARTRGIEWGWVMQPPGVGMVSRKRAGQTLFPMLTCAFAAAALLLSQGAQTAAGQNPFSTSAPDSTPTFKSSSRLVVVDVVVTGRDGNPIAGLDKADFTVLEDGKVQALQSF